jgi:hypothetical protein
MREELDRTEGSDVDAARALIESSLEGGLKLEPARW